MCRLAFFPVLQSTTDEAHRSFCICRSFCILLVMFLYGFFYFKTHTELLFWSIRAGLSFFSKYVNKFSSYFGAMYSQPFLCCFLILTSYICTRFSQDGLRHSKSHSYVHDLLARPGVASRFRTLFGIMYADLAFLCICCSP